MTPESRAELEKMIDDGDISLGHSYMCLSIQSEDNPELPDNCSCGSEAKALASIEKIIIRERIEELDQLSKYVQHRNVDSDDEGALYYRCIKGRTTDLQSKMEGEK